MKIGIDSKTLNRYVKYLWIIVDCHLDWKKHIQQLSKKYLELLVFFVK